MNAVAIALWPKLMCLGGAASWLQRSPRARQHTTQEEIRAGLDPNDVEGQMEVQALLDAAARLRAPSPGDYGLTAR
jgi:hypothetical protein